jgi:hypothetical protein
MIDVSKIKKGDKIIVELTVTDISDDMFYTKDHNGEVGFTVYDRRITGHTPKPREIKVGDIVTPKEYISAPKKVEAIVGGYVIYLNGEGLPRIGRSLEHWVHVD